MSEQMILDNTALTQVVHDFKVLLTQVITNQNSHNHRLSALERAGQTTEAPPIADTIRRQARDEALEEAARVSERLREDWIHGITRKYISDATEIAAAIRALKSK